jgi:transcriptional regulator with XRE-family HTH domain
LSKSELAAKANLSAKTITAFESGRRVPHVANLEAIRRVSEGAATT